jgi:hypothetical protein
VKKLKRFVATDLVTDQEFPVYASSAKSASDKLKASFPQVREWSKVIQKERLPEIETPKGFDDDYTPNPSDAVQISEAEVLNTEIAGKSIGDIAKQHPSLKESAWVLAQRIADARIESIFESESFSDADNGL